MYSVYVLKSIKYLNRYVGSTENVSKRIRQHNKGRSKYTKSRGPWELICQEDFKTRAEAVNREKFLKSGQGRKFLDEKFKKNN